MISRTKNLYDYYLIVKKKKILKKNIIYLYNQPKTPKKIKGIFLVKNPLIIQIKILNCLALVKKFPINSISN